GVAAVMPQCQPTPAVETAKARTVKRASAETTSAISRIAMDVLKSLFDSPLLRGRQFRSKEHLRDEFISRGVKRYLFDGAVKDLIDNKLAKKVGRFFITITARGIKTVESGTSDY